MILVTLVGLLNYTLQKGGIFRSLIYYEYKRKKKLYTSEKDQKRTT